MRFVTVRSLVILVCAGVSWSAQADFDLGMAAINSGDYYNAMKEFKDSAELGDARSQFALGEMYFKGFGVPEDQDKAAQWFVQAAEQGSHAGQQRIGYLYSVGTATFPRDMVLAYMWTLLSANQGNGVAQSNLDFWVREKEISVEEVERAKVLASEWQPNSPSP